MTQPIDRERIQQLLREAINHHIAGRLDPAEKIYRQVLAADPLEPNGLHLLGVIESQRGNREVALNLLQQAIAQLPNVAEFHRHLADTLAGMRRYDEAFAAYRR